MFPLIRTVRIRASSFPPPPPPMSSSSLPPSQAGVRKSWQAACTGRSSRDPGLGSPLAIGFRVQGLGFRVQGLGFRV